MELVSADFSSLMMPVWKDNAIFLRLQQQFSIDNYCSNRLSQADISYSLQMLIIYGVIIS